MAAESPEAEEWITVGAIRSANPARREIRIVPHARYTAAFENEMEWLHVAWPEGRRLRCKLESMRVTQDAVIARLGPGVSRDAVAQMRRAQVVMPRAALPRLSSLDVLDYPGMRAVLEDGTELGEVTSAIEAPAHDVLVVQTHDGRRVLLPAIEQVVQQIDMDARTLTLGNIGPYMVVEGEGEGPEQ